jgi:hypothetical protein
MIRSFNMKKILFLAGLLLGMTGALALAAPPIPTFTYQVGVSSITTNIITVSNSVATQMDNPQLSGRVAVEVQNIDASANLWCLPTSTPAPAASAGRKIAAGNSWIVSVLSGFYTGGFSPTVSTTTVNIFCISDGGGSTKAAVTQIY